MVLCVNMFFLLHQIMGIQDICFNRTKIWNNFPQFKPLVTYEILQALDLDKFKDWNWPWVRHYVIKKFLGLYFQLECNDKIIIMNIKVHWNFKREIFSPRNQKRIKQRYLIPKSCLVEPFLKNSILQADFLNLH
jgi:hypothetical protein